jgi:acyl-CoA thioester hydrolase
VSIPAPLELWRETVRPEWIDYNGHMNVAYYTLLFDHGVDRFFDYIGLGQDYRDTSTGTTMAVEQHILYRRELLEGATARCTTQLIGFDEKRIHHYHEMFDAEAGFLAATCEFMTLHVDSEARRVSPLPRSVQMRLGDILAVHESLPRPEALGRAMKVPSLSAD